MVVSGGMDLDAMEPDPETVCGHRLHGSGHETASFEFAGDPVADGRPAVPEVRSVESDDPDDLSGTVAGGHDRPVAAPVPPESTSRRWIDPEMN